MKNQMYFVLGVPLVIGLAFMGNDQSTTANNIATVLHQKINAARLDYQINDGQPVTSCDELNDILVYSEDASLQQYVVSTASRLPDGNLECAVANVNDSDDKAIIEIIL